MDKLLILHTGGTIGMAGGPDGLRPARGLVEAAVTRLAPAGMSAEIRVFDPLVDSAEIGPKHWNRLIDEIVDWCPGGVVVTHGTDTLSFTGAALAEALGAIPASVVLCAAMKPLGAGGDAEDNLSLALTSAACGPPGVRLAFNGRLLPAAGLVKHHSQNADAFRSTVAVALENAPFRPRRFRDRRVAIVTLSPGMPADAVAAMLECLDGAVIRAYGAGTMASDPDLEAVLASAVARGCRLRAVSQCEAGGLSPGAYAAGAGLWRAGVENGGSETAEMALVRIWLADAISPPRL